MFTMPMAVPIHAIDVYPIPIRVDFFCPAVSIYLSITVEYSTLDAQWCNSRRRMSAIGALHGSCTLVLCA